MMAVSFVVEAPPPWKQVPADAVERNRQVQRLGALRQAAQEAMKGKAPLSSRCAVFIRYVRSQGRADGANIVGGVLDGLQGIAFDNDRQVAEATYQEQQGPTDRYQVTVIELAL